MDNDVQVWIQEEQAYIVMENQQELCRCVDKSKAERIKGLVLETQRKNHCL